MLLAWWRLSRGGNALLAALAVVVGALVTGTDWTEDTAWRVLVAAFAALLGTAGGNALNDVLDLPIDRKAHPERPLPAGRIGLGAARAFVLVTWAAALVTATIAGLAVGVAAAALLVLMLAYENALKRWPLAGNAAVAVAAGALFPFGAIAVGGPYAVPFVLGGLAALAHLGRELQKDAEDAAFDRGARTTFAVRYGERPAARLAALVLLVAIVVSPLPHFIAGWGDLFLYYVGVADLLFLGSAIIGIRDPRRGRALAKVAMYVAMAAFLLGTTR